MYFLITTWQPRRNRVIRVDAFWVVTPNSVMLKDRGSMDLWNVSILQHTASQHRRQKQNGPLKRWYTTTTLHGVTAQKMEAAWTSETLVSYQHYTASQPRRPRRESSPPWKPQVAQI